MKTTLDCIPCLVRQALDATRRVTADETVHERIVRDVLQQAATMDWAQPPPVLAQAIHRRLRQATGNEDPYQAAKRRQARMAQDLLPELEQQVANAADPLLTAARLAIAGNVIDLGARPGASANEVRQELQEALSAPFQCDADAFRQAVAQARHILYLADNAGEIVFDRLLIAQLPRARVTLAVRGAPVINDATLEDARAAGLEEWARLIDNGSDAPGTLLDDCAPAFLEHFRRADLVIAKGQGNFESLSGEGKTIFFLFNVKCPVIADHIGQPVGTPVLVRSPRKKTAAVPPRATGDAP